MQMASAPTATAAGSRARSTSWASAGRCSSCASCAGAEALHRPAGRPAPLEPGRPYPAPARPRGRGQVCTTSSRPRERAGLRADRAGRRARAGRAGARPLGQRRRFPPAEDARIGAEHSWSPSGRCSTPGGNASRTATPSSGWATIASAPASQGGRFTVAPGTAEAPDAVIATDRPALAGAVWHGRPLDALGIAGPRQGRTASCAASRCPRPLAADLGDLQRAPERALEHVV